MATTVYSYSLRLLACENCGAPIELSVEGGGVQCAYCQAKHQVVRRDDQTDHVSSQQALASAGSESERLERLRAQDRGVMPLPQGLAHLLSGSELAPDQVQAAEKEWLQTLRRVKQGSPFAEAERLFHLTLLLRPHLDDRRARAFIESAKELLTDLRHRQVLRCLLAHRAVVVGDLQAAEQWLWPCNPRPVDLLMDTAFRLANCYWATARRDYQQVLSLLGYRPDDVPIADDREAEAMILRANALENMNQARDAHEQLLASQRRDPRAIHLLTQAVEANRPLPLCTATFPPARATALNEIDNQLRPEVGSPIGAVIGALVSSTLFIVTFAAIVFAGIIEDKWTAALAIGVNSAIWAFASLGATLGATRKRKRAIRLRDHGTLSFAHVGDARKQIVSSDDSHTVYHDLVVSIRRAAGVERLSIRVEREEAPAPGIYPILIDPVEIDRSVLKL